MGDVRFERPYDRLRVSRDPAKVLRSMTEEGLVEALASASRHNDPYLANTLATEALNRIRRLRAAVRNLGEGIVTTDRQGIATYANPMAARLLGLSTDAIVGRDFVETAGLGSREVLDVALEGRAQTRDHETMQRADGTRFPVLCTSAPILSSLEEGHEAGIEGVVLAFLDATPQKRAQEAVADSMRFLQSTLDALPTHVAILDERGDIVAVNRAWRDFAEENGLAAPGHGIGVNYLDVCQRAGAEGEEAARRDAEGIRAALEGRIAEHLREYPCHGPNEKRWFILRARAFRGKDGRPYAVVSHENVTPLHQVETMGGVLEAIASASGAATFATTVEGDTLLWNQEATDLFGHSAKEALGRPVDRLLGGTPEQARARIRERVDRGETVHLPRARCRGKDGRDVVVDLTLTPVRGRSGKVVAVSAVARRVP